MKFPDIPPKVAREVMQDMRAFYAEPDGIRRDGIAATTLHRLGPYLPKHGKRFRLTNMKQLFREMTEESQ